MSNYTKPDNPEHEDAPEDWLISSLIFANAIGYLLQENEGIVINTPGDAKEFLEGIDKLLVFSKNERIITQPYEGELEAGERVIVHNPDENLNE